MKRGMIFPLVDDTLGEKLQRFTGFWLEKPKIPGFEEEKIPSTTNCIL